jgi:hypothetical protein
LKPEIERQELRAYLLGTLDGDHKTQFEERILTEPGIYEELLLVEEELIDQYVAGELSALEQQEFESHFLITAERQKNLRFGKLLQKYADSHTNLTDELPIQSFSSPQTPRRRWAWMGIFAAILGCAGIIFVRGLVNKREAASVLQQTSRVITVTLVPGSAGIVSPKGAEIKLELKLTNPTFYIYKSELFRENKSLKISDKLRLESKGEQFVVPFTITGEMLSPGDYEVKLSGVDSGGDEFVDNYSFRVIE